MITNILHPPASSCRTCLPSLSPPPRSHPRLTYHHTLLNHNSYNLFNPIPPNFSTPTPLIPVYANSTLLNSTNHFNSSTPSSPISFKPVIIQFVLKASFSNSEKQPFDSIRIPSAVIPQSQRLSSLRCVEKEDKGFIPSSPILFPLNTNFYKVGNRNSASVCIPLLLIPHFDKDSSVSVGKAFKAVIPSSFILLPSA